MTQFTTHGPFKIPTAKLATGRTISKAEVKTFWEMNASYRPRIGCYVFGMRAGKGITPYYVGKATTSFDEAFTDNKLTKYHRALNGQKRGAPVMFFVAYPKKKGAKNLKHIIALEKILIQQGVVANPKLLNIVHAKVPTWGIAGVLRSVTKKPSNTAVEFKALLGFRR